MGEKHRTTLLALADLLHTRGKVADEELAQAWNRETDAYTRTLEARRNDLKRPFVRPRPRRRSPRRADQRARSAPTEPAPAATEGSPIRKLNRKLKISDWKIKTFHASN